MSASKREQKFKVWKTGYHAKEIYSNAFSIQKLSYEYQNSVVRTRSKGKRIGAAESFKRLLAHFGFDWNGVDGTFEPDYVTDLGFGGLEMMDNLWPLEKGKNRKTADIMYGERFEMEKDNERVIKIIRSR